MSINEIWVFLGGVVTTCGGAYVWLRTTKSKIQKEVSDNRKSVTVNEVESNKALLDQMDSFLNQITTLYEAALKDKIELSQSKTQNIAHIEREESYKSVIELIRASCETCRITIEKILKSYNL